MPTEESQAQAPTPPPAKPKRSHSKKPAAGAPQPNPAVTRAEMPAPPARTRAAWKPAPDREYTIHGHTEDPMDPQIFEELMSRPGARIEPAESCPFTNKRQTCVSYPKGTKEREQKAYTKRMDEMIGSPTALPNEVDVETGYASAMSLDEAAAGLKDDPAVFAKASDEGS